MSSRATDRLRRLANLLDFLAQRTHMPVGHNVTKSRLGSVRGNANKLEDDVRDL